MRPSAMRVPFRPVVVILLVVLIVAFVLNAHSGPRDWRGRWFDPLMMAGHLWTAFEEACDEVLAPGAAQNDPLGNGMWLEAAARTLQNQSTALDEIESLPMLYPHFLIRATSGRQARPGVAPAPKD